MTPYGVLKTIVGLPLQSKSPVIVIRNRILLNNVYLIFVIGENMTGYSLISFKNF